MHRVLSLGRIVPMAALADSLGRPVVIGLGVAGTVDAIRSREGVVFIALLTALLLASIALLSTRRVRDVAVPIAQPLAGLAGALLAIEFGLGVTDVKYAHVPSLGQLSITLAGLAIALAVAQTQVVLEERRSQRQLRDQLERLTSRPRRRHPNKPIRRGRTRGHRPRDR